MKRLWAWAGRNSRLLILVLFYLSFLGFIFYAINNVQINDTLLGVIIALLFPVFATFVNHLLKQDLEQRQWQREEAERERIALQNQRAELRLAYQKALKHVGQSLHTSGNIETLSALHEALAAFSLFLPLETDLGDTTPEFKLAVGAFRANYGIYIAHPKGSGSNLESIAFALDTLSLWDPRIRPTLHKAQRPEAAD